MTELTKEYLRECMTYDVITGLFTWKHRPVEHFNPGQSFTSEHISKLWNSKFSGTVAGSVRVQKRSGYKCCAIEVNKVAYLTHRLVWLYVYGKWPEHEIDHINGDGTDNSFVNLRAVTRSENMQNQTNISSAKGKLLGVSKHIRTGLFLAVIQVTKEGVKKRIYLGWFKTAEEAHKKYVEAKRVYHTHGTL